MATPTIGILSSGKTDLISVYVSYLSRVDNIHIGIIILSRSDSSTEEFLSQNNIAYKVISPDLFPSTEDFEGALCEEFVNAGCDSIFLCNFTRIISKVLLTSFPDRILCTYPSLLPAFCEKGLFGENILQHILSRQIKITGATTYIVSEDLGQGKILDQMTCTLSSDESTSSLHNLIKSLSYNLFQSSVIPYIESLPTFEGKAPSIKSPTTGAKQDISESDYFNDERKEHFATSHKSQVIGICDKGLKRLENMDTVLITNDAKLIAVADGIGSARGGKMASRLILKNLSTKWLDQNKALNIKGDKVKDWLSKTVAQSNRELIQWNEINKNQDLGSTLVIASVDYEFSKITILNIGDSRGYLWRNNTLYRVTQDHSEDFDPKTGQGGDLLYFIGGEGESFHFDLYEFPIQEGDKVLLCTDGLLYMEEDNIAHGLTHSEWSLSELSKFFLERTYEAKAPDNIGFVVLDMTPPST